MFVRTGVFDRRLLFVKLYNAFEHIAKEKHKQENGPGHKINIVDAELDIQ